MRLFNSVHPFADDQAMTGQPAGGAAALATRAGASAIDHAQLRQLEIELIEEQVQGLQSVLSMLRREADSYLVGGAGEVQVVQVLLNLGEAQWFVLADRAWPGTRRANLDAVVVGPGGLFVIDVKTWRDARIQDGALWHGQVREDSEVGKVRDQARDVAELLVDLGFPPSQVNPMIVLAGRSCPATGIQGVTIVGERHLHLALARMGVRLTAEQISALVAAVDASCPPMPRTATTRRSGAPAAGTHAPSRVEAVEQMLFDPDEVLSALVETACAGPIESWMTWLHPSQSTLVGRTFKGPARIRGAAGTGKTVVALHRAKYLAEHSTGRVLVTSFVRNLPAVQQTLFVRMAPGLSDRVEFASLHQWASRLLRERGTPCRVDDTRTRTAFSLAWAHVGRDSILGGLAVGEQYWRDEITAVIKGRGITEAQDYYGLDRLARRIPLQPAHRRAVWDLLQAYEAIKAEWGIHDWADLVLAALASVADDPVSGYSAVIIDEVQDLTVAGIQLMHSLVGDQPNGLILVGDGQQSIYVGAFTAAEAGINIKGRSTILKRNYRNAAAILERALQVVAGEEFADLAAELQSGSRDVDTDRPGGMMKEVRADDERSLSAAALNHLDELLATGVRAGDIAVLCTTSAEVDRWLRALRGHGAPVMALADYDGHASDRVKIGTYHRGKGLEFAHVLIPDLHRTPRPRRPNEPEEAYRERAELEHRQLFVAMTRARDGLWLGQVQTAPTTRASGQVS